MHEASIALALLEELDRLAEEHEASKVVKVRLRVGRLSGVVVDCLVFAFDAAKESFYRSRYAEIEVEEVPIRYRCRQCGCEFEVDDFIFPSCDKCSSLDLELICGEELDIAEVEFEG